MARTTVDCPICGAPASRPLAYRGIPASEPLLVRAFRGASVWRCEACGHGAASPMPDEALLAAYYEKAASVDGDERDARGANVAVRSVARRVVDAVRRRLGKDVPASAFAQLDAVEACIPASVARGFWRRARTLEIGAGSAAFSRAVRLRHPSVRADVIEPSRAYDATYRRHDLRRVATLAQCPQVKWGYRVVHAAHVVEHIVGVRAAFDGIADVLAGDGIAIVEVPNAEPPYWTITRAPDPPHLHFFTARSLRLLAVQTGFTVLSLASVGASLADEPGYVDDDTPEIVSDEELGRLHARRTARLAATSHERRASGPGEHLRMVMRLAAGAAHARDRASQARRDAP